MEEHEWELEAGGVLDWLNRQNAEVEVAATPDGGWKITKTGQLTAEQAHAAVARAYELAAEQEARWAPLTEGF